VAGAVNDLLLHPTALASTAVRVAHATLKGKLFEQFAAEVKDLREKGALPDNFADKKNGYNTWVDLLKIIDDESPDEDHLEALKAMFLAANRVNATDGERIVAYELFQIAKTLSSNGLLVLMTLWKLAQERISTPDETRFLQHAQRILGHTQEELIRLGYGELPQKRLVQGYAISPLGAKFCDNIAQYRIDTAS
jgi:hypothetical protein